MNRINLRKNSYARFVVACLLILAVGKPQAIAQSLVILTDPIDVSALSGQVKDPIGGKIKGAHVDLLDIRTGKILASTNTNDEGNFKFQNQGKSAYRVKIFKPNFMPLEATIRLRKNAPILAVFTLRIAV
jgi:hypothetical protein